MDRWKPLALAAITLNWCTSDGVSPVAGMPQDPCGHAPVPKRLRATVSRSSCSSNPPVIKIPSRLSRACLDKRLSRHDEREKQRDCFAPAALVERSHPLQQSTQRSLSPHSRQLDSNHMILHLGDRIVRYEARLTNKTIIIYQDRLGTNKRKLEQ